MVSRDQKHQPLASAPENHTAAQRLTRQRRLHGASSQGRPNLPLLTEEISAATPTGPQCAPWPPAPESQVAEEVEKVTLSWG
jgi:hypothetical protein